MASDRPRRHWLRRLRAGSVRVRTTAAATAIVGLALAIGGLVLVALLQNSVISDIRAAAELRAQDVVVTLEAGRAPEQLTVDNVEEAAIQVVDRSASGAVVAASANLQREPPIATIAPGETARVGKLPIGDDASYLVVAAGTRDGRFLVLVARTLDPAFEVGTTVGTMLLIGLPILLLLVGVTTWAVTGRALRPVEAIRREVSAISASELSRRVPEPAGDDEIARLASTMNAMLGRLQSSGERQRRFLSDASHELRSPIASIRHQLDTALAHPDGTRIEWLAREVLAENIRMERLVSDLLLLARADEDLLAARRRPVDLDDHVLAEAARLRELGTVRVDTAGVTAARTVGDPGQLRSMVRNLVDNAERHAASTVQLTLRAQAGAVRLTVTDDGDGIAEADRERVFERFTRLDDARARDTGGTGLGLAIVADVVRAHGGTVAVESGSGACFVVVLPAVDTA